MPGVSLGRSRELLVLDDEFHHALCDLSGHGAVWAMSERAKVDLNRVRRLSVLSPMYLDEMIREHAAIVEAVGQRDAARAEDALRHHLRMVLSELPRIRAEHPDFFCGALATCPG